MAATLPAIHSPGGTSKSPSIHQHRAPSVPSKGGSAGSGRLLLKQIKRTQGKKERDLVQKQLVLRAQQPDLSKRETAKYINTYKHSLCLDMLQEGFHKSFAELFALIKQQQAQRENAGPDSLLWTQPQLQNEPEKLDMLKMYLTASEAALRKGNYTEVYKCQWTLARYFQEAGDKWLSDHFFMACLDFSANIKGDGGRMKAEGHCNVGLALEESGDIFEAASNFEEFHKLSADKSDWQGEDGRTLHCTACFHLTRIYTTIGNQFDAEEDSQKSLEYLSKAYNYAREGGEKSEEGDAGYRLGVAYEKAGDSETALLYLNGYLDICQALKDSAGIGKACEAISKSYESQGKINESIRYLEMFVEVAEGSKEDKAISRACSDLGTVFNSLGKYEQATEYFNKAYNISRAMNDTEAISSSRVLFGVAMAHKMMAGVSLHVEEKSRACLERLIEWKDNRGDEFEKDIPKPAAEPEPVVKEVKKASEEQPETETQPAAAESTQDTESGEPAK